MKPHLVYAAFIVVAFSFTARVNGQAFPPIAPGATSYTISPAEAGLAIDTLYLPKGFTLKFDPSIRSVDWSVSKIRIEEGATIDLSASQTVPARAGNGSPPPGQAGYCATGAGGAPGGDGKAGLAGINLTIHNLTSIDNQGSLWIRTDGGPGGDGGNGGNGQQGGGHRSIREGLGKGGPCGAAGGGAGGRAGSAGTGGTLGKVVITYQNGESVGVGGQAAICGSTQRPASAQGAAGVLVIWGGPGCPGVAGSPGAHGIGG